MVACYGSNRRADLAQRSAVGEQIGQDPNRKSACASCQPRIQASLCRHNSAAAASFMRRFTALAQVGPLPAMLCVSPHLAGRALQPVFAPIALPLLLSSMFILCLPAGLCAPPLCVWRPAHPAAAGAAHPGLAAPAHRRQPGADAGGGAPAGWVGWVGQSEWSGAGRVEWLRNAWLEEDTSLHGSRPPAAAAHASSSSVCWSASLGPLPPCRLAGVWRGRQRGRPHAAPADAPGQALHSQGGGGSGV